MLVKCIDIDEMIHGDKFAEKADVELNFTASGEKTIRGLGLIQSRPCIIFCKTDLLPHLFNTIKSLPSDIRHVLITHNSDFPINDSALNNRPECIHAWYCQNKAIKKPNLYALPIGLERPAGGGYSARPEVIVDAWKEPKTYDNLVYLNFNENNNHGKRDSIVEMFKDKPWVTYRKYGTSFDDHIKACCRHKFVFSPEGNGIDTHRTWEALYCGAIPIVQRSAVTDYFSEHLPMLAVENEDVITEELLCHAWDGMKKRKYDYDMLTMSYWWKRIRDSLAECNE